jgi:hypothetical protein
LASLILGAQSSDDNSCQIHQIKCIHNFNTENQKARYELGDLVLDVAGRRGRAVFARLNTGIVGSNPARGMDVCLRLILFVLSCVGSGLAMG